MVKTVFPQDYVHQVFVLNEGYFDYGLNQSIEPVTIGVYNPNTQNYLTIDTIDGARFASDLVIDNDYFYVAADNMLHKYDKNNYNLMASQQIEGIRNLAIWNDKIIISRGDYDNTTFLPIFFNSYLQIYNTSDLSLYTELDTTTGPKWATQNLIIDDNKLYVAINNAYEWGNEKGIIGVLDLNTFSYLNEINLGPDGINPDNMVFEGDYIYTINNKDWSGSSISQLSILTNSVSTINLASVPTGCGTSCLRDGKINYQISGDTLLYEWDILMLPTTGISLGVNQSFYDLSYDKINNLLYASSTDFSTYGDINIYNQNNSLIHSFQCGISPGTIVFDIRNIATSIHELMLLDPCKNRKMYNLSGKRVNQEVSLPNGLYIKNNKKIYISK
jgi:hypothetical protein